MIGAKQSYLLFANRFLSHKLRKFVKTFTNFDFWNHGWKARKKLLLIKNSTQRHLSHFSELPISIFYGFFRFFRVFSAYFADFHAKKFSQKKTWKNNAKKKFQNFAPTGNRTCHLLDHIHQRWPLHHGTVAGRQLVSWCFKIKPIFG